jgi:hypothetical protein
VDEIQDTFNYAKSIIEDDYFNKCNRNKLKDTMLNYKKEADSLVNFILKDKAGVASKTKCERLNEINKNIGYILADFKNKPPN